MGPPRRSGRQIVAQRRAQRGLVTCVDRDGVDLRPQARLADRQQLTSSFLGVQFGAGQRLARDNGEAGPAARIGQ
jgi:hypothetical protein